MKKFLLWMSVFLFISCTTLTENNENENVKQPTIQYDESIDSGSGGPGDGSRAPRKPPKT